MKTEHEKYHEAFEKVKSRPKSCELKPFVRETVTISILLLEQSIYYPMRELIPFVQNAKLN